MKTNYLLLFLFAINYLTSCKSKEDKANDTVDKFLTQINDHTKPFDNQLMTDKFEEFFKGKGYYTAENWKLTIKPKDDSTIVVEAKGQTHNGFGQPTEVLQGFSLLESNGKWKIFNSYNLVADELDFEVVDTQWNFYWDRDKVEILEDLQKKLKLQVIRPGYGNPYTDSKEGKLKIINNSDYDVKGVEILIEHFDSKGNSVNTDHTSVYDIIRKHGYREFEWYTSDCSKCVRQEFRINFIKESH